MDYLDYHNLTMFDILQLEKCDFKLSNLIDLTQDAIKIWFENYEKSIQTAIDACDNYLNSHYDEFVAITRAKLINLISKEDI